VTSRAWLVVFFLCVGCSGRPIFVDGGGTELDAGPGGMVDAGPLADGGGSMEDAGARDAGMRPDAGPLPEMSEPSPPASIEREGSGGFLLRGTVLTPTGPLAGDVLIVGDTITCVAADCSGEASADTVTVIETFGVISPGLVDAHNHLTYDFLPEWEAGTTYGNRYEWTDVADYETHILPFTDGRNENARICPGAKWGELRSIVHGTTTVMGQSANRTCLDRLARNADHHHDLGYDHMRTTIGSPRELTDSDAMGLVEDFADTSNPVTRYAVHMQEGVTGDNVLEEFDSFAGRDPRPNRHMGTSLLAAPDGSWSGVGLLIHSMSLTEAQLMEANAADASVVWSPSSNLVLYGETAPIARMLELDMTVAIGPDWTLSGEDHVLDEMRFAYAYGRAESIAALTPQRLWEMATAGGAHAVGLQAQIGALEPGMVADVTVFGRRGMDPYAAVLDSEAEDVRLVLIGGQGYYGDLALEMVSSINAECDMLDACGSAKFLCTRNTPGGADRMDQTVEDVEDELLALLAMYGREADLEPLVRCD